MNNGIFISETTGVEINGVRCGLVSDYALFLVSGKGPPGLDAADWVSRCQSVTREEKLIGRAAACFLDEMRRKGYSKEATRKAFVRKIVDEAQRVRVISEDTANAGTGPTLPEG